MARLPSERITPNALGAGNWSARDDLHVQGCLSLSQVGLLFPVNHAPESGVPGRLRSGDLLLEKQACWLDYTTGTLGFRILDFGFRIYTAMCLTAAQNGKS